MFSYSSTCLNLFLCLTGKKSSMWGEDTLSRALPAKSAKSWIQWCRKTLLISCSTKKPKEASKLLNVATDLCKATAETLDLLCVITALTDLLLLRNSNTTTCWSSVCTRSRRERSRCVLLFHTVNSSLTFSACSSLWSYEGLLLFLYVFFWTVCQIKKHLNTSCWEVITLYCFIDIRENNMQYWK